MADMLIRFVRQYDIVSGPLRDFGPPLVLDATLRPELLRVEQGGQIATDQMTTQAALQPEPDGDEA